VSLFSVSTIPGEVHEVVMLRTVWNEEELSGVIESLREQFQSQHSAGIEVRTIPIASTNSDLYFALNNKTGEVMLEEAGYAPLRVVAPTLTAFLVSLDV
jgi:hypothetical protein